MIDEATAVREIKHVRLQGEIVRLEKTKDLLRALLNEVAGNYDTGQPGALAGPEEIQKTAGAHLPPAGLAETLETAPQRISAICEEIQTDIIPQLKLALF